MNANALQWILIYVIGSYKAGRNSPRTYVLRENIYKFTAKEDPFTINFLFSHEW